MSDSTFRFVPVGAPRAQQPWPSIIVPRRAIEAEIERLADEAPGAAGVRASAISHPSNTHPVPCFAPGIDVTLHVVLPGESTPPLARSASAIDMCIGGAGVASIGRERFGVAKFDVWNTPSMEPVSYANEGSAPFVRLSYSNAPLLEKLEVHYVEEFDGDVPPADRGKREVAAGASGAARELALRKQLTEDGAWLLGYEWLIDIDVIESKALHWPWAKVSEHLPSVNELDMAYNGRRLFVLYNPATERRIGTTHSFFATLSSTPPGSHHIPHRHSSAAINYYLRGHGYSYVDGQRIEWKAGDLLLSAPGWVMHAHHTEDAHTSALTIQDHPLQIAMESLIWQERMEEPIRALGSQRGFESNRAQLVKA